MTNTGLHGPFALTKWSIDANVIGVGPGAYALGPLNDANSILVYRVGRSDTNLNSRLHRYEGQYTHFLYGFYPTPKDAYEKECRLYHQFNPRDNEIHPDRPVGTDYVCPVCAL